MNLNRRMLVDRVLWELQRVAKVIGIAALVGALLTMIFT